MRDPSSHYFSRGDSYMDTSALVPLAYESTPMLIPIHPCVPSLHGSLSS